MAILTRVVGTAVLLLLALAPAAPAAAHDERDPVYPDGTGSVPTYRTDGPRLLVCKDDPTDFASRIAAFPNEAKTHNQALFAECQRTGYRHIQAAVDAVRLPGTRILVLPGTYREEPSLASPPPACADLRAPKSGNQLYQVLSFEQQRGCPHVQNLVAVIGKRDLQIEGTGVSPLDVVVDAAYQKLNAIRADRANGFYLRNLTAQRTTFNAVYILETDGFVIDRVTGRWNDEYGFLTFADDHGLYTDCEAYGNGDSGVYPGAASNINANRGHQVDRYAIEIRGCYSHHNLLGYSGTAGDSVWAHDNVFTGNGAGVGTDSAFPNHPGMPQNHARFERNVIGDNNEDYYRYVRDGTCARPYAERGYEQGVVCPAVGLPVGTGVINPGGNYNIWRDNWVYGHKYAGFVTSWVPGQVRGDTSLRAQFDTSHHNRYLGNKLGVKPDGGTAPNRMDFWWDGQGRGSCWQAPSDAGAEPLALPACGHDDLPAGLGSNRAIAEPGKLIKLYVCSDYSLGERRMPGNCDWYGARGLARIEVQWALGEALLLGLVGLALWVRVARRRTGAPVGRRSTSGPSGGDGQADRTLLGSAGGPVLLLLAGLAVGVFGTAAEATWWTPTGLLLTGLGWLGLGWSVRAAGRTSLGWLTVALGGFALLGALDRGLLMVPVTPIGPVWIRILLELVWVPWALLALRRRRVTEPVRT